MTSLSSTGHGIIGSGISLAIVSSIAVVLRLSAKRATKAGFAADDYWIIFALVTFWVYLGVELWGNLLPFAKALESEFDLTTYRHICWGGWSQYGKFQKLRFVWNTDIFQDPDSTSTAHFFGLTFC